MTTYTDDLNAARTGTVAAAGGEDNEVMAAITGLTQAQNAVAAIDAALTDETR